MDTNYETTKIKLSSKLNKKAPPILATFSCGQLNDNSKIEFECFKATGDGNLEKSNTKRILMAQTKHLTYEGSLNDNSSQFASQYFIGVRSKRTGKMKLYDTSFYHLRPKLNKASDAIVNESPSTSTYWESRNKLTAAFGGKVSKRVLSSQLKFNVDTVESSNIEALPTPETPPLPQNEPNQNYLPSMNKEATSLDDVFDIYEIVSPEDNYALQGPAQVLCDIFKADPDSVKADLCTFSQYLLEKFINDLQKVKYLLYYNYMVIFQNLNYNEIRKKDPTPLIPEPFKQNLINKFTSMSKYESGRTTRVLPPQQRDKLVAYIFVLALLINDHCVNLNQIIKDLKRVTPKQLNTIAQTLGCHITSEKVEDQSIKIATLRFPLADPPIKFSKKQF